MNSKKNITNMNGVTPQKEIISQTQLAKSNTTTTTATVMKKKQDMGTTPTMATKTKTVENDTKNIQNKKDEIITNTKDSKPIINKSPLAVEETASVKEQVATIENQQKKSQGLKETWFKWTLTSAENVLVTGSFNKWNEKVKMNPIDGNHQICIPLEPGKYVYKFVVDDQWCYDLTAPTEMDEEGNVNNVIIVA